MVTAWNTIEHMADPLGAFTAIARIMRPGALLALSTGDVTGPLARFDLRNWNLMVPPYHLSSSRRRRSTCSWRRPASSCVAWSTTASSPRAGRSLRGAGQADGHDGGPGERDDGVRDRTTTSRTGARSPARLAARYRPPPARQHVAGPVTDVLATMLAAGPPGARKVHQAPIVRDVLGQRNQRPAKADARHTAEEDAARVARSGRTRVEEAAAAPHAAYGGMSKKYSPSVRGIETAVM